MVKLYLYSVYSAVLLLVTVLAFGLGLTSPLRGGLATVAPPGAPDSFRLVGEAWQILKEDYVDRDKLDPYVMTVGAIRGMVEALGDPHTSYIDAETFKLDRNAFEGSFEGIGATVAMVDGHLTIIAPIAGSPAEKAGLRPRDRVLEVNGRPTQGMSLADAVARIRGKRGSTVVLTVLHEGEGVAVRLEIVRDRIRTSSVHSRMLRDQIAHLRITHFTDRTEEEIKEALSQVLQEGAKGIVLDLRSNPGGLLQETVAVTSQFLKEGIVLYEIDKSGQRKEWRVRPKGLATEVPLALLVNRGSASGSEVLAGALQDQGRAVLIGESTFGKGAVNHVRELSDHSALYVTISRWLTPKGRQIEGQGLTPDIVVSLTREQLERGEDRQLDRALQYLTAGR